jgi:hypothetical protein
MPRAEQWVYFTDHAASRWRERAARTQNGPRLAWFDATEVHVPDLEADEVCYHKPIETLILRHRDRLLTVIAVDQLSPSQRRGTAVLEPREVRAP